MEEFNIGRSRLARVAVTHAIVAKIAQVNRPTRTTVAIRSFHFLKTPAPHNEILFHVDEDNSNENEKESSIDMSDLPTKSNEQTQTEDEKLVLMQSEQRFNFNRRHNRSRMLKPTKFPFEEVNSNCKGWQTKSVCIICHGCYVRDDHILPK